MENFVPNLLTPLLKMQWLESSSSEFEEPGAVEFVISQLNRGNKNPMLRLRCWKHIVIELVSLVDSDSEGATGKLQKYRYITGYLCIAVDGCYLLLFVVQHLFK